MDELIQRIERLERRCQRYRMAAIGVALLAAGVGICGAMADPAIETTKLVIVDEQGKQRI